QVSSATYAVNESQATAIITVTRTGGSTGTVSVHYATSDGTATAGSDYAATSGTLTFANGETTKTFTVQIVNDTQVEGNETIKITMGKPTCREGLESPKRAVAIIQEDESGEHGSVQFSYDR